MFARYFALMHKPVLSAKASQSCAPRMDRRVCNAMDRLCRLARRAFPRADHFVSSPKLHVARVMCAFDTKTTSSTDVRRMQMCGLHCRRTAADEGASAPFRRKATVCVRGRHVVHVSSSNVVDAVRSTSFSRALQLLAPNASSPRPRGCSTSSKARLASAMPATRRLRRTPGAAIT